jgi:hypothetical protein
MPYLLLLSIIKGLDIDQTNNTAALEANEENENNANQDTNQDTAGGSANNGSNTPNTAAKQKKMFFNKKVSTQFFIGSYLKFDWSTSRIFLPLYNQ